MRNSGRVALAAIFFILLAAPARSEEGSDLLTSGSGPYIAYLRAADGSFHRIPYTSFGGLAIAQSDVILGTHEDVQQQTAHNLAQQLNELDYKVLKRKPPTVEEFRTLPSEIISPFVWVDPLNTPGHQPWPRARIPYTIDASVTDATLLAAIKQAAAEWNRLGVMEVKPTAEFSPSEILGMQPLTIYSTSVLKDDNGRPVDPNVFSCFTYIGYDSRSSGPNFHGNYMYLSNKCKPWSVAHELGHALGLRHEHARTDRDAFINANLQLVGTKHRGDYQKQDGQGLGVSYDPCSIMHYKDTVSKDWSTTGQQEIWFTLKPPGQAALDTCRAAMDQECSRHAPGQRCGFSPSDIEVVRRLYQ